MKNERVVTRVHPLEFEEDPKATDKTFLHLGKILRELSMIESNWYMSYKGLIERIVT